jgi:hypothetical protein
MVSSDMIEIHRDRFSKARQDRLKDLAVHGPAAQSPGQGRGIGTLCNQVIIFLHGQMLLKGLITKQQRLQTT